MSDSVVRLARPEDCEALLALMCRLDEESPFMMLERGERKTTADEIRSRLEDMPSYRTWYWVAEVGEVLVGYLSATRGEFRRNFHAAALVVGVLREQAGRGLGTRLLREVERWARAASVSRLELTVMTHNEAAIRLYKKMGFADEGVRRNSLRVAGRFVDEHQMAKLLST